MKRLDMKFTPTVCLVTGASSGIGEQVCRKFIADGNLVIGIARNSDKLEKLQKELGRSQFLPFACDTSQKEDVEAVSQILREQHLVPKIFVLNAGAGERELTPDSEVHRNIFDVNYFGCVFWIEEWLWSAREKGAQFVVISSLAAIRPAPFAAAYGASKAALKACIESLRVQYSMTPLGFTIVMPGPVATKLLSRNVAYSWTADKAANRIVKAAYRKEKIIRFPLVWTWLYRCLSILPDRFTASLLN